MKEATEKVSLDSAGWSQVAREGSLVSETCGGQGGTQRAQSPHSRGARPGAGRGGWPARRPGFRRQPALVSSGLKRGAESVFTPRRSTRGTRLMVRLREGMFKCTDGADRPRLALPGHTRGLWDWLPAFAGDHLCFLKVKSHISKSAECSGSGGSLEGLNRAFQAAWRHNAFCWVSTLKKLITPINYPY